MNYIFSINSGLRFILEILSVFTLVWLGFSKFKFPLNLCVGILLPAAFIFLWSVYIAPGSTHRAGHIVRFIIELIIFISISCLVSFKLSLNLGICYLVFSVINNTLSLWGDICANK